ncbi:unnamed protein product [Prorocentrum cordatum]|uniref:Transmembrane protein 163 n=1 Tax=Prorocentrum cordatum TaxID=2364126 RepID=A0ABN9SKP0_9DINO|nr:unnamed protein product [Polarella glacialis]
MAREVELNDVEPRIVGASDPGPSRAGLRQRNSPPVSSATGSDDEEFLPGPVEMPSAQERRWSLCLAACSGVDVVMSAVIAAVALGYGYKDSGVSLYCLAVQSISHWISSLTLALRFLSEGTVADTSTASAAEAAEVLLRTTRRKQLHREQALNVTMGCVMLISAAGLLFKAARKFKFWNKWYLDHAEFDREAQFVMEFLAWYGFSVYVLTAVIRLVFARKLRRQLIWHGFVVSVISLTFLFVLGVGASYQKEWSWKAEPIAAMVLCVVSLVEGVRVIIMHLDDMDTRMRFDPRA